jgi:lysine 2,3-aminomutase
MCDTEGRPLTLPFFSSIESLSRTITLSAETRALIADVAHAFPFRITPFYARLMQRDNEACPIRLQAVPSGEELAGAGVADPLGEREIALTPCLFKRYPRRAVFLAAAECAMYCRFCNRKRLVGTGFRPEAFREETLAYLERHDDIDECIISGGDPLILSAAELEHILRRLRAIAHLKVIRISSRMPVVSPERVHDHVEALRRYGPVWFIVHINHPREVTPEFLEAVRAVRAANAAVVSQTVLLRRGNDCPHILGLLFDLLVRAGIKPYYLFQLDDVTGAAHFKVRIETGLAIMKALRRSRSGLSVPQYAVDITGGLGKVPLEHGCIKGREGARLTIENLYGERGVYMDDGLESTCNNCGICGK